MFLWLQSQYAFIKALHDGLLELILILLLCISLGWFDGLVDRLVELSLCVDRSRVDLECIIPVK